MSPPTTVLHKEAIQNAIDEVCASNGGSWRRAQKEHLSKVRRLTGSPLAEETLMRDGFSDDPLFYGLVLEQDTEISGVAIFFVEFSTWEGRVLFLKRLVVPSKDMRVPVLRMLAQIALLLQCVRLVWQVQFVLVCCIFRVFQERSSSAFLSSNTTALVGIGEYIQGYRSLYMGRIIDIENV